MKREAPGLLPLPGLKAVSSALPPPAWQPALKPTSASVLPTAAADIPKPVTMPCCKQLLPDNSTAVFISTECRQAYLQLGQRHLRDSTSILLALHGSICQGCIPAWDSCLTP